MDAANEQRGTTPKEVAAAESKSANNGSRASDCEQFSPSKERETNQSAQPFTQDNAATRAGRSSGPITNRGKKRSRRNALTHGVFAKVVLLGDEPSTQFDSLLQGFRNDFRPEGTIEDILVEKLATLTWRYRRMLLAERAEIRAEQSCSSRAADREKLHRDEALTLYTSVERHGPGLLARCNNPLILDRCVNLLRALVLAIELRGFQPSLDEEVLAMLFGESKFTEFRVLYGLCVDPSFLPRNEEYKEFHIPPEARRTKLLGYLRYTMDFLEHRGKLMKYVSDEQERIESISGGVPEALRLERLLKYSTSLERGFDRTLNQLERLQRIRKGQAVPPTLNVNVST